MAIDWYASLPPRARWSLSSCMARFFEAAAAGVWVALILCANQSAVSLGWFWAMARSYPMTRSATTSCSPSSWGDLDARRSHWSSVVWTSRPGAGPAWFGPRGQSLSELRAVSVLSVLAVPRGSPAVSILLRTARELRWSLTYERACMFICACWCGTHVYSTRTGPGHGLRTPYPKGCTARVNTGACSLHFACVRAVRCSAWIVRAVVYLECVCVCVRQSVCVARLVSFVQRFVCQRGSRALYILSRVGTSCWYLFGTVLRLVSQTRANVPS